MAAGGGQQSQPDNSMSILWGISAILIFGGVLWYNFKSQIIAAFFKLKLAEISLIGFFTTRLEDVRSVILLTDTTKVSLGDVLKIGDAVGDYIRIPLVLIVFGLAVWVYLGNNTRSFKHIYNMRDLMNLEKTNWPQITPVASLDLINTDIDKGPWAMALTPMQFCKKFKLVDEIRRQPLDGMLRKERGQVEAILKRGAATKMFVIQLGTVWRGIDRLPLHVKALFAVFAARINNDGKGASDLLAKISASSSSKLDFTGTDELLKKHASTKLVQEIMNGHAYVLTVMAAMLAGARMDGVQASADFLWLKPVDRRMWYMLNTVGRQTPFCEVAGPFAHWVAEREIGKKLLVPMVEEATNALDGALKEIIYKPDETPE